MQKKILAIDPALVRTGWAVVGLDSSRRVEYIASGVIVSNDASMAFDRRLLMISCDIKDVIRKYNPSYAAIEETYVNSNPRTSLKLGAARGAAILTLAQGGLDVAEYPPATVKKTITGRGGAEKAQLAFMLGVLLVNFDAAKVKSSDETDAIAIAITHALNV